MGSAKSVFFKSTVPTRVVLLLALCAGIACSGGEPFLAAVPRSGGTLADTSVGGAGGSTSSATGDSGGAPMQLKTSATSVAGGVSAVGGQAASGIGGSNSIVSVRTTGGDDSTGGNQNAAGRGGISLTGAGSSIGRNEAMGGIAATGGNGAAENDSSDGGNCVTEGDASDAVDGISVLCDSLADAGSGVQTPSDILTLMRLANDYFVQKWPDPTVDIVTNYADPSNVWNRAVYYEGLMALYGIEPEPLRKAAYYDYAVRWANSPSHPWQVTRGGTTTRNADDQCCGQTYIDLYMIEPQPERIRDIKADIDNMMDGGSSDADWSWIDTIQMAMPVFAKLGLLFNDASYFEKMHSLYVNTRNTRGLYNPTDHLWWRDSNFKPPKTTPGGKQCYWSRGNGWVFAGLVRVLDTIPTSAPYRSEYIEDFTAMANALQGIQRPDGFWNVSLADPTDYGGPELTGTALYTYGMAWGLRRGILDPDVYGPIVTKAWCALASAVHSNGFLGYVQSGATKPSDGQPVTYDSVPNLEDFGLGCLLLAGSELYRQTSPRVPLTRECRN